MKAARFHEYGGPGVLRYEEVERPVPGAGEVLIEVAGTSFNPVDAAIRAGYVQQVFPASLPGRRCSSTAIFNQAIAFSSTARAAGSAVSPCSSPSTPERS